MRHNRTTWMAFFILFGISCQTHQQKQYPVAHWRDSVLAVHDSAMAKMDLLHSLIFALKDKQGLSDSASIILRLRAADRAMMDWMHQFRVLPDTIPPDSAIRYYQQQLSLIKSVSDSIHQVIQDAQTLLP